MPKTRLMAVYNWAGGVAKTTTTRDLGFVLSVKGFKVLLLDADSQGSLGDFLGCSPHSIKADSTFWYPVCKDLERAFPICQVFENLSIGLANDSLSDLITDLENHRNPFFLSAKLRGFVDDFDFVLIDCPPNSNEMTIQVLAAVGELLIPTVTEDKGLAGLERMQQEILKTNKRRKSVDRPLLSITGILPTRFDKRTNLHRTYLEQITNFGKEFDWRVFDPIRQFVAVSEACAHRVPLLKYDKTCMANEDYASLAEALL